MSVRVTILGCGGSMGVPTAHGRWGECDPQEPRNRRTRPSIWVEHDGKQFLIDTGPDLAHQLIRENITARPDAILYTHAHADHIHGIDDLRCYYWPERRPLQVYGHADTIEELDQRFRFIFHGNPASALYEPIATAHVIPPGTQVIEGATVTAIQQQHGPWISYGYRFGDIAYCTDIKLFPEEALANLQGLEAWIISVSFLDRDHPTHANLPEIVAWANLLKPKKVYLTHLNVHLDYHKTQAQLPPNFFMCYDGLKIEC